MANKTATFTMRMTPAKKQRMEEFFEELGLSLAYGVNIFFEHCIMASGLPFLVKLTGEKKTVFTDEESPGMKTAQLAIRLDPYKNGQVEYIFPHLVSGSNRPRVFSGLPASQSFRHLGTL